jgi:hypothetical protein
MAGDFFSSSSPSSEISPPPTLSPQISPSLSNEVALHHPVIASPVIVALRIAIARVEGWPRGKAPGGSTVGWLKMTTAGRRLEDSLLACNLSLSERAS